MLSAASFEPLCGSGFAFFCGKQFQLIAGRVGADLLLRCISIMLQCLKNTFEDDLLRFLDGFRDGSRSSPLSMPRLIRSARKRINHYSSVLDSCYKAKL